MHTGTYLTIANPRSVACLFCNKSIYYAEDETPLWPVMARRRDSTQPSVPIMMFRIPRIFTGPVLSGLRHCLLGNYFTVMNNDKSRPMTRKVENTEIHWIIQLFCLKYDALQLIVNVDMFTCICFIPPNGMYWR